jgi:UDP-glucose 4-epimerase
VASNVSCISRRARCLGCAESEGSPLYVPIDDDHPLRAARSYGMSKRLAEEMCAAWTSRTGRTSIVLQPVMILGDDALGRTSESDVEFGAFVHVDDVVDATVLALDVNVSGHVRMTLCGPGLFDTTPARNLPGWSPRHGWDGAS